MRRDGTGANFLYVKTTGAPTESTGWLQLGSAAGGPGTAWDYAQITSNVTVSAASEATATTVVSGSTITYDGTAVIVEFFAPAVYPAPNDLVSFWLYLDGSSIAHLGLLSATPTTGNGMIIPVTLRYMYTPTAGGHTFSIRASRSATNATIYAGAGGQGVYVPAFLRVTKA